jgi:putative two-component system response regulator
MEGFRTGASGGPDSEGPSQFPSGTARHKVLLVDDEPAARATMRRALRASGCECLEASSGDETLEIVSRSSVSVVLLDLDLGGEDGLDVLMRLAPFAPEVAVVIVTGNDSVDVAEKALSLGACSYLTKPMTPQGLRMTVLSALGHRHSMRRVRIEQHSVAQRLSEMEATLDRVPRQFAESLVRLSRFRDDETGSHVVRIGRYTEAMAIAAGFDAARAGLTGIAATMHDLGKIGIPDAILRKPGPLTEGEFSVIKTHTTIGANMLAGMETPLMLLASEIALGHHERWDGTGYPEARRGAESPIEARMVAVVDVYDALSHPRVYKPGWPEDKVLALFREQRGRQFEPDLVDTFFGCLPTLRAIRESLPEDPASQGDRA